MKERDRQYTIRRVPDRVDEALREKAARYGTSLNEAALSALTRGAGLDDNVVERHDLDDLAGTWETDHAFDKALKQMDRIDEEIWK